LLEKLKAKQTDIKTVFNLHPLLLDNMVDDSYHVIKRMKDDFSMKQVAMVVYYWYFSTTRNVKDDKVAEALYSDIIANLKGDNFMLKYINMELTMLGIWYMALTDVVRDDVVKYVTIAKHTVLKAQLGVDTISTISHEVTLSADVSIGEESEIIRRSHELEKGELEKRILQSEIENKDLLAKISKLESHSSSDEGQESK
jgi:hypothetical protein